MIERKLDGTNSGLRLGCITTEQTFTFQHEKSSFHAKDVGIYFVELEKAYCTTQLLVKTF